MEKEGENVEVIQAVHKQHGNVRSEITTHLLWYSVGGASGLSVAAQQASLLWPVLHRRPARAEAVVASERAAAITSRLLEAGPAYIRQLF